MKLKLLDDGAALGESPLAEGRELKWDAVVLSGLRRSSPLAEGRELKLRMRTVQSEFTRRPSRRGVN